MTKKIVVALYNLDWPRIFEIEALKIKEALGAINPRGKQVTIGASEASKAFRTSETIAEKARRERRIDLTKPQQANCHLFVSQVNTLSVEGKAKSEPCAN